MAFQVFDPRGFNTQTDYSGLTQGIGQLIQGQIANHFAKKAEEGDAGSMARLSSIDPRRAATLGSILDTRRQEQMYAEQQAAKQQQQQEEQKRALMGRIARGYVTAKDKVGYLSAAAANMDRAGFSDVADMIMVDLSKYKEAPGEVDQQYQAVQAMFGDGGGENPAQVQYMQYLTQGFEPEDELNARRTAAGLAPKAQAQKTIMIAGVPHNYDPNTGGYTPAKIDNRQITADDVASDAATIKGAEAGASEQAKLDAQANMRPKIEADITKAKLDAEKEAGRPQAEAALKASLRNIENSLFTAEKAMDQVGVLSAGPGGKILANFGGTKAADLRRTVDTLKASLSFDALAEMRRNSPTGGALGSVTERELELLGSTVASLDQAQSPTQLKENLQRVIDHYNTYKTLVNESYKAQYSGDQPQSTTAAPGKRLRFNPATGRLE